MHSIFFLWEKIDGRQSIAGSSLEGGNWLGMKFWKNDSEFQKPSRWRRGFWRKKTVKIKRVNWLNGICSGFIGKAFIADKAVNKLLERLQNSDPYCHRTASTFT